MGGKTENCRVRHSIAVFFLKKVFAAELWRRRVEGGRLPKPLAVHQILVRGICVKDGKWQPISKMCRHCSSREPLLQEPCTPPTTPAEHTSCKRGCCFASSYSSCSVLYKYLSKASKPCFTSSPHSHSNSSSSIHIVYITSPSKHTPPSVNSHTPCVGVSLISQPEQELSELKHPCCCLQH